jgi:DNA-binding transcriptional regulator GbsR (MarR family)
MGSRWGVNRTVAQVHALLYLSPEPLTAEDIAETLAVARSNVSTSLRELQNWQLVQATHQMGDRRDFFSTSHDVWQLFLTVIEQRVEREIEPTIAALGRLAIEARAERQPEVTARIANMHSFLEEVHGWYRQVAKLPPSTLRSLVSLGAGVTKWLPSRHNAKGEKCPQQAPTPLKKLSAGPPLLHQLPRRSGWSSITARPVRTTRRGAASSTCTSATSVREPILCIARPCSSK